MKMKLFLSILIASCVWSFISCNKENEWQSNVHELKIETSEETAMQGEPFTFTDLSLGIVRRTWTFEDGIPAMSQAPVVVVEFTKDGMKKCTLEVVYDNGQTERREFTINVLKPLLGTIHVAGISPMNTVPRDVAIQFNVQSEDDPTSYSWIFPGGSPLTSTDVNPVVTWDKRGFVTVEVEISRSSDNASMTIRKDIHVGNYPLLVPYLDADMDSWSFDAGSKIGKWIIWDGAAGADMVQQGKAIIVSGGADNTDKSMQLDYNKAGTVWEVIARDNWVNNAKLEKGQKYEFIFWMKADADFSLSEVFLANELPDWSWNELLDALAERDWAHYFPDIPFSIQTRTTLARDTDVQVTTSWNEYRYEFTIGDTDLDGASLPERLLNTYPAFIINSSIPEKIYIDEIQINLIEE